MPAREPAAPSEPLDPIADRDATIAALLEDVEALQKMVDVGREHFAAAARRYDQLFAELRAVTAERDALAARLAVPVLERAYDLAVSEIDPQVRIGHVHLKVAEIERSLAFYCGVLGFELQQRLGDEAAFVSAGGYHHHIAINTWESKGGSPPPPGTTGLFHLAVLYPDRRTLADALRRVVGAGIRLTGASDHGVSEALYLRDPDGNGVELYRDRPEARVAARRGRLGGDVQRAARPRLAPRRDMTGAIPLESLRLSETADLFEGRDHGSPISFFVTRNRQGTGPTCTSIPTSRRSSSARAPRASRSGRRRSTWRRGTASSSPRTPRTGSRRRRTGSPT